MLAVALGGALGSVLRLLVATVATQRFGPGFPYGTFAINISGSFAIGLIAELALTRVLGFPVELRTFLTVGVLGGFTTFSSFSLESLNLIRDGAPFLALAYALGSVALGVSAAYCGVIAARLALP
ncbi:MAG TPA: fluoride efflux transporter CrcB [Candidatus Baltobacteraceae bacterium]|nr:fluoride efflux transporter CrcB [Candidatus Baltobacteraceae bacterium]